MKYINYIIIILVLSVIAYAPMIPKPIGIKPLPVTIAQTTLDQADYQILEDNNLTDVKQGDTFCDDNICAFIYGKYELHFDSVGGTISEADKETARQNEIYKLQAYVINKNKNIVKPVTISSSKKEIIISVPVH